MGKIVEEYETAFDRGDIVIFKEYDGRNDRLKAGIVEGYAVDDNVIWYDIRVSNDCVYTYSNGKDVAENDIICKIEGDKAERCRCTIVKG